MITSKQRSYLAKLSNDIPDILLIGKGGINYEVIEKTKQNLKARELIKGKVLQNAPVDAREAADLLAKETKSDVVRVIGKKFVLYKQNHQKRENVIPTKNSKKKIKKRKRR